MDYNASYTSNDRTIHNKENYENFLEVEDTELNSVKSRGGYVSVMPNVTFGRKFTLKNKNVPPPLPKTKLHKKGPPPLPHTIKTPLSRSKRNQIHSFPPTQSSIKKSVPVSGRLSPNILSPRASPIQKTRRCPPPLPSAPMPKPAIHLGKKMPPPRPNRSKKNSPKPSQSEPILNLSEATSKLEKALKTMSLEVRKSKELNDIYLDVEDSEQLHQTVEDKIALEMNRRSLTISQVVIPAQNHDENGDEIVTGKCVVAVAGSCKGLTGNVLKFNHAKNKWMIEFLKENGTQIRNYKAKNLKIVKI